VTLAPLLALLLSAAGSGDAGGACLEVAVDQVAGTWGLGPAWHLPAGACPAGEPAGPLALQAVGPRGLVLASVPLAPAAVADAPRDTAGASVRLRIRQRDLGRLRALELREGEKVLARREPRGTGGPERASVRRRGRHIVIRWDARAWPFALVRDAVTGTVLASGIRGRALVTSQAGRIELLLSDGVRGRRLVLPVGS
jgi:hypothetical protein